MLTVKEVASILRVDEYTVRIYLRTGKLKGVKIGSWRIKQEELDKFIEGE